MDDSGDQLAFSPRLDWGVGQVIGGDFIMFYSTGVIYRSSPELIYDFQTQTHTQSTLVAPTLLPGYNPYMNPPFMAPVYSLLTIFSLPTAMIIWTILAVLSVFMSVFWSYRLFGMNQKTPEFPYLQLVVITLSFFPFIEGLQAGQNHWITLLLVCGIIYSMFKDRGFIAGGLAGLLIYKPQFVLGFLLIWLIWKNYKALISFGIVAIGWAGLFMIFHGFGLFQAFLQLSQAFMVLPYIAGFPNYLLVTVYGLLTSIFPQTTQPILSLLSQVVLVISAGGLAWLAFIHRKESIQQRIPVIVAALVLPLLATPYALLHDMVILIPAYVLWRIYSNSRSVIYSSVIIYLGAFFLTFIAVLTKFAWVSLLVIGLSIAIIVWARSARKSSVEVIP